MKYTIDSIQKTRKLKGLPAFKVLTLTMALAAQCSYAQDAATEAAAEEKDMEYIQVTGSRIARSGIEAATPVNVVNADDLAESGFSNVYDVLKSVPSIGVGLGGANSSPGGLPNGQAGASFVNLRGLGTDRSLVLVDGRRRVSGSADSSAVDMTMIPAGLIEQVEIITGGASAVYGADAVSGVVNMIMKDDIDGLELSVSTGASTAGSGGERFSLDLAGGTDFDNNRGSLVFGLSYSKEYELKASQRDFSRTQLNLRPNPDNTGPDDGIFDRIHVEDLRFSALPYGGRFIVAGQEYTVDPDLRLLDFGTKFDGLRSFGGTDGFQQVDVSRLRPEQEVLSMRTEVNYEINNNVSFFTTVEFGQTETLSSGQPDFDFGLKLQRENPLLPQGVTDLMDANGLTEISVNRDHLSLGLRSPRFDRTSYNILAGFEGELSNEWKWDVAYQFGSYETNSKWKNFLIAEKFHEAIDVISDPTTGEAVCRSGAAGCLPVKLLGTETPSQDALNYFQHTALRFHRNQQQLITATLSGEIMELPAGYLQFASGLEYRKESIETLDDGLARQGQLRRFRGATPQDAELSAKEAFLELDVPLVVDQPFFYDLGLEAAIRVSNYDTIGTTTAWKLGFNWAFTEDVRLRVSSATSVRAPNLSELFSPGITSGAFLVDPCDDDQINLGTSSRAANCAALGIPTGWDDPNAAPAKEIITGGNENLSEEESESFTAGIVLTPSSIDGLSFSIDYWDIEITNAIGQFDFNTVLKKCVDSDSIDNVFCPLIVRDAQLSVDHINLGKINVGQLNAKGIDFEGHYDFDIADGNLAFSLNGSYLLDHEELVDSNDPTSLFINKGGVENPEFRTNLNVSYTTGALSVSLNNRYIGSVELDQNALTDESIDKNDVPSRLYNDLVVGYEFENELRVTATVSNLFDIDPPKRDIIFTGANGNYDNVGRFISIRASYNF